MALLVAVLVFLLPGFAWLLVSGLFRRLNILSALAFSFILSICLLSVTSASLSFLTSAYLRYTIGAALILPIIATVFHFSRNHFHDILTMEISVSPLLLLCLAVYVLFLAVYFWSTPYYPATSTSDPFAHAQFTQSIASGEGRSVLLYSNYPVGFHFASAIMMSIMGMNATESVSALSSLVLVSGPVLIYVCAQALFHKEDLAALTAVVGTLILPVDAMHFILLGTYPNVLEDAIILATLFLLFSYLKEPSMSIGVSLAFVGAAGLFTHSSYLLFLAVLWVLSPIMYLIMREKSTLRLYFQASVFSTVGILFAGLVALSFLKGNLERVLEAYSIVHFIGGATTAQLLRNLAVMYQILVWNLVFLIKPLNLIAIVLGFIFVMVKAGQSIGRIFTACWFATLVLASLASGQTDRFVLFSMIPAIFIVGNLVGNIPSPKKVNLKMIDRKIIIASVLVVLVAFGGFVPLIPIAFDPGRRSHQENIVASMEWLEQNHCPSGIASIGMRTDYRYLPILTDVQYSGYIPSSSVTNSDQVLQESETMGFACVVVQTYNPIIHSLEANQAFQERYRNTEVAIFFITSQGS
jgi:hypothetical protein